MSGINNEVVLLMSKYVMDTSLATWMRSVGFTAKYMLFHMAQVYHMLTAFFFDVWL